jgi:hypothetical protein
MIIGYELYAVRKNGSIGRYEVCCKAERAERRAELRKWIAGKAERFRVVCRAIRD